MDPDVGLNITSECGSLPALNLSAVEDAAAYILNDGIGRNMLTVLFSILIIGVPGNLAFLFVVARVPYMRTTTNVYLSSLAVADLMFLLISIVQYNFYFSHPVRSHLPTASFVGCFGAFMPQYVTYFASVFMVTLVSLERYNCICRPFFKMNLSQDLKIRQSFKLVIGSWVVAVGLAGLTMVRYAKLSKYCAVWPDTETYENLPVQIGFCAAVGNWGYVVGHLLESVVFIIAMVANVAMYTSIIIRLHTRVQQKRDLHCDRRGYDVHAQQALHLRNQFAVMLVTNGVVFFLCQTPFIAISLGFLVAKLTGIPPSFTYRKLVFALTVCHVFVFLNSAVNPIIYSVTSRHYRHAFVEAFSCSTAKCYSKPNADDGPISPEPNNCVAVAVTHNNIDEDRI